MTFKPESDISERVIFPVTESQSHGIEDARFVEFSDGGRKTYYATYTAYSGPAIRSELIETSDFHVVPNDARCRAPPHGTKAWRCSRAGSTANTP